MCFHSAIVCVWIYSPAPVMPVATQRCVCAWHEASSAANSFWFRYGASMNSWVWCSFAARCSSWRRRFSRSGDFTGRYPLKAKFCPLHPLAMSARRIDDGPTSGTTRMFCFWARATIVAPGSATAGQPASERMPMDFFCVTSGSRYIPMSALSVCSFSSKKVSVLMSSAESSFFKKRIAERTFSTIKKEMPVMMVRLYEGSTCSNGCSLIGTGIKYSAGSMAVCYRMRPKKTRLENEPQYSRI